MKFHIHNKRVFEAIREVQSTPYTPVSRGQADAVRIMGRWRLLFLSLTLMEGGCKKLAKKENFYTVIKYSTLCNL